MTSSINAQLAEWRRLIPAWVDTNMLTVAEGDALAAYCTAIEQWILAISKYGLQIAELDELMAVGCLKQGGVGVIN
jgi:phage terminase small subunit